MLPDQKSKDNNNASQEQTSANPGTENVARNPNPRANENVRVRTTDPAAEQSSATEGVGSEITDGEDA